MTATIARACFRSLAGVHRSVSWMSDVDEPRT